MVNVPSVGSAAEQLNPIRRNGMLLDSHTTHAYAHCDVKQKHGNQKNISFDWSYANKGLVNRGQHRYYMTSAVRGV
jgi:hypothetical protein